MQTPLNASRTNGAAASGTSSMPSTLIAMMWPTYAVRESEPSAMTGVPEDRPGLVVAGLDNQVAGQGSESLVRALKEATPQALAKTLRTPPQATCS